jgi:hypothetical protein
MTDLGLPITDRGASTPVVANTSTAILPSISPAPSLMSSASSTSASTLSATFPRPPPATDSPFNRFGDMHYLSTSSPIKSGFKIPARPDSALSDGYKSVSDGYKPVSDLPCSTPQISRPYSTASAPSMQVSTPLMRFASFDHTSMPQAPLYLSQIEREVLCPTLINPTLKKHLSLRYSVSNPPRFATYSTSRKPSQLHPKRLAFRLPNPASAARAAT